MELFFFQTNWKAIMIIIFFFFLHVYNHCCINSEHKVTLTKREPMMALSSSRVILPWEITFFFPLDVTRALLCLVVRSAVTSCRCLILGHRKAFFYVKYMLRCWAGYASTLWFSLRFIAVILSVAIVTKLFLRIEIRFFWICALSLQIFIANDMKV